MSRPRSRSRLVRIGAYALVEDLRASGPRGRTAGRLAEHLEVSVRTIERDLATRSRLEVTSSAWAVAISYLPSCTTMTAAAGRVPL